VLLVNQGGRLECGTDGPIAWPTAFTRVGSTQLAGSAEVGRSRAYGKRDSCWLQLGLRLRESSTWTHAVGMSSDSGCRLRSTSPTGCSDDGIRGPALLRRAVSTCGHNAARSDRLARLLCMGSTLVRTPCLETTIGDPQCHPKQCRSLPVLALPVVEDVSTQGNSFIVIHPTEGEQCGF